MLINIISLVIIFIEFYFYRSEFIRENRNLILRVVAVPAFVSFIIFFTKKWVSIGYLIDSGINKDLMGDCFVKAILLVALMLGFLGCVCPYICHIIGAYQNHKNFSTPSAHVFGKYQKMNIKLFNKCFEINPEQFVFHSSVNRHYTICYKYVNKEGVCGIVASNFLCYLWMWDCIIKHRHQEEKNSAEAACKDAPISDDVKKTLEMRIEEIDKEMQKAIAAYKENAEKLKNEAVKEEKPESEKIGIYDNFMDRYEYDGNIYEPRKKIDYLNIDNYVGQVVCYVRYNWGDASKPSNVTIGKLIRSDFGVSYGIDGDTHLKRDMCFYHVSWEMYELERI